MSATKTAKKAMTKPAKASKGKGFTAEEKAAMRQRVKELQSAASRADGEQELLAKIAEMEPADRAIAKRLHAVIKESEPDLAPRLWYGMPAYYKDGKLVIWFQDAKKFKTRYATVSFSDKANLDEGAMWPVAYAVTKLTPSEEARIVALLKAAVS